MKVDEYDVGTAFCRGDRRPGGRHAAADHQNVGNDMYIAPRAPQRACMVPRLGEAVSQDQ